MAKQTVERTDYHNAGTVPIVFEQGTSPNDYAEKITVEPGETYKGFVNYKKFYLRSGLSIGPSPTAGAVRAKAAEGAAQAARMKSDAEEAKLEALEAKREAEAARAEAELAIADANAAKARAALIEQVDDIDDGPMNPVTAKAKAKPKAKAKAR